MDGTGRHCVKVKSECKGQGFAVNGRKKCPFQADAPEIAHDEYGDRRAVAPTSIVPGNRPKRAKAPRDRLS